MNIYITNININSISNIGSLNIGKTILCKNRASFSAYQTRQVTEPPAPGLDMGDLGGLGNYPALAGPDLDVPRQGD